MRFGRGEGQNLQYLKFFELIIAQLDQDHPG